MNIIESARAVSVTPDACIHSRLRRPSPGDVVDFIYMEGKYPYDRCRYGTIEGVGIHKENEAHVCCEPGSIFLGDDYVRISGGPFECIPLNRLVWDGAFRVQWMWNWGPLGAGAGHACYVGIQRPVFTLLPPGVSNLEDLPRIVLPTEVAPPHELLGALDWCIRQMQGESGTGDTYWEQFPQYQHAVRLLQNHERIPPASPDDGSRRLLRRRLHRPGRVAHELALGRRASSAARSSTAPTSPPTPCASAPCSPTGALS